MIRRMIAVGLCGVFGLVLAPACDGFGLGGGGAGGACGGAGGDGAVCEIVALSPCEQKCEAEYDDAALTCAGIQDDAKRKACQDGAYAVYKDCRAACVSASTPECDEKYQECIEKAPTSCLKEEAAKKVCQRCWERCNAGDSPSSRCKKCLF